MDGNLRGALDTSFGRQVGHPLECTNELRPAVRITRVVDRVHSDEDVRSTRNFRIGECKREKNGVARWHIRCWYLARYSVGAPMLWYFDVTRESRSTKCP